MKKWISPLFVFLNKIYNFLAIISGRTFVKLNELIGFFLLSESKMFAGTSLEHLKFYGSIFLRTNKDKKELSYDVNLKMKLFIMFSLAVESIKNLILIKLPMSNELRYMFCDILISTNNDQRSLNFIIVLAMSAFLIYLILLINLDQTKLKCWFDFLVVDDPFIYAKKHNLTLKSAKKLSVLYQFTVIITRFASLFYLIIVYIFYIRSFIMAVNKSVNPILISLVFIPSNIIAVKSVSIYYLQSTKNCTLFILFNIFQFEKLNKLSNDLTRYEIRAKENRGKFKTKHLLNFQKFLKDFQMSQIYFNYSNFSFLVPLFLTIILYPFSMLKASEESTNFLIISYLLNVLFALLPLFSCTSFFNHGFKNYLNSIFTFVHREPNVQIKNKLTNTLEIYFKTNKISYTFFDFFYIDLKFALNVSDS